MSENISPIAAGIIQGLQEAIQDSSGNYVEGLKKNLVYRVEEKDIHEQKNEQFNMSQTKNNFIDVHFKEID